jgi:nucleoside 2-deoxyribosyltransferase
MLITRLAGDGVFEPEELAVLRETLEQLCLFRGISPQSPEAEYIAQALIAHYTAGLRGEELIRALIAHPTSAR